MKTKTKARKAPIPVETFKLPRCSECQSTRLSYSKSKLEREGDETIKRSTYVLCRKCGRKIHAIFD